MKPHSSDNQRGAILVLFVSALVVMLLCAGLVVDLGVAYVSHGRLVKSADAGALAGARHASRSDAEIETVVRKVAGANYPGVLPASFDVGITVPAADTKRIFVSARTQSPALFTRVVGLDGFALAAAAEAIRYPLDMSLVLDISYSLEANRAFDDLQDASVQFVNYFDESVDQLGLVTYTTWAEDRIAPAKGFKRRMQSTIRSLSAVSDTNIEEGLRLGKQQLDNVPVRENAIRIVVLFTDGRPTAFADVFEMQTGNPASYDGIVAGYQTGSSGWRGLYQASDGRKVIGFVNGVATTDSNNSSRNSPQVRRLPDGSAVNSPNIRRLGAAQAEAWADQIRRAGYTIYTVGLGDPNASDPLWQPDLNFLRRVANEDGIVDASQPAGALVFAPTPEDLEGVFAKLAERILTRLTR
jgi:Flp pilus assembly protein TadG